VRIAEADAGLLAARLSDAGLSFDLGAARVRLRSDVAELPAVLQRLYGAFPLEEPAGVFDATVDLRLAHGLRRVVRPQVRLVADSAMVFEPFPARLFMPLLEWGMNYLLATRLHCYLLLHAGVVESAGIAVLLPATPGSGKSTLTAALTASGFRLLSDEFGVVGLDDFRLRPLLRPVGLKNESIDVVSRFCPNAVIGPRYEGTRKGTVAHLAPDHAAVAGRARPAEPGLVVFPRFVAGSAVKIEPVVESQVFARLAFNSFNYELLGARAFDAVASLVHRCAAYRVVYGELQGAVDAVQSLAARHA
jgi:HprK-related kinase A